MKKSEYNPFNAIALPDSDKNVKSESWVIDNFLNGAHVNERYATESCYVEMTDRLCAFLYEHRSDNNRRISKSNVAKMARDIRRGEWKKTTDTFKVWFRSDDDGQVVPVIGDANHRINAFWNVLNDCGIPSGCYIRLAVCNYDEIAWHTDKNKTRSSRDSLRILGKNPDYATLAKMMSYIFRDTLLASVSENEILRCASRYEKNYAIFGRVFDEKFSDTFAKNKIGVQTLRPLQAALLAAARANRLSDKTVEEASEYVCQCLLAAFGAGKKPAGKKYTTDYVGALRGARPGVRKCLNGFKSIRLAGLSTVAVIENLYCGGKHDIYQHVANGADFTPCADDKIRSVYNANSVF